MADTVLNILVKVAGQKEFNELVQKQKDGNITHEEQIRLRKLAHNMWLKAKEDINSEAIESKNLVAARELVSASAGRVMTANGKIMKSYFQTGEEIRRNVLPATKEISSELRARATPAVVSFSQVIQDAPYGIRGVANNIEYLTQQMILMRQHAGNTKTMFRAIFSAMTGPMGILMAVSLVSSLAVIFGDKLFGGVKKTYDELKKLNEEAGKLDIKLGRTVVETQLEKNRKSLFELRKELAKLKAEGPGFWEFLTGRTLPSVSTDAAFKRATKIQEKQNEISKNMDDAKKIEFDLLELDKQRVELGVLNNTGLLKRIDYMVGLKTINGQSLLTEKEINDLLLERKGILDETRKKEEEAEKRRIESVYNRMHPGMTGEEKVFFDIETDAAKVMGKYGRPGRKQFKPVSWGREVKPFKDAKAELTDFQETAIRGVLDLSSLIGNNLSLAWQRSFGEANSVAEQFFMRMAQMLAEMAARMALLFALKQIPGIGPFVAAFEAAGSSRSGGGSSSMPAVQMAMNTGLGSQRAMQPQFTIINKITPKGLATTVENGNRQNTRSRV